MDISFREKHAGDCTKIPQRKKKTILSLFTHPYVNPNQAFISPTEH